MELNKDFESRGPLNQYVAGSFGLSDDQMAQIVKNTSLASGILSASCKAGKLRFDLDPEGFLSGADPAPTKVPCGG